MCASVGVSGVVCSSGWLPRQPLLSLYRRICSPAFLSWAYRYATRGCGQTKCAPFSWAACRSRSGCRRQRLIPTSSGRVHQACDPPVPLALTHLALQTLRCGTRTSRKTLGDTLPRCHSHCHVRSGGSLRNPRTKPQFGAGA